MFADPLSCVLDGDVGVLPYAETFLATHIAVPMLEELTASFADSQLQTDAFSVTVFCLTAFAVGIIG